MNITKLQLQEALTEWDRLWREYPEEFENIATMLLKGSSLSYGEEAAPFLLFIIDELKANGIVTIDRMREWVNEPKNNPAE